MTNRLAASFAVRTFYNPTVMVALALMAVIVMMILAACGETTPSQPGSSTAASAPESAAASAAATPAPPPAEGRLALVQQRGELICGVNDGLPGFGTVDSNGQNVGFDVDFCHAIAAAVLGDPDAIEFRAVGADNRSTALQSGEIDVLIRNTTWTVTRDTSWGVFAPTTVASSRRRFPVSVPASSVNSGTAMLSLRVPPPVTFRKTSTPWARRGRGAVHGVTEVRTSSDTTSATSERRDIITSPSVRREVEAEMHAQERPREVLGQRRERRVRQC